MLKATIPAEAINLNERSLSIGHLSARALRNWRSFHFLVLTPHLPNRNGSISL